MKTEQTLAKAIGSILPSTFKTCFWLLKMTVSITFVVFLMEYFGVLPILSQFLEPLFNKIGLPGSAAFAYVTGYFANVYSAIAVATMLDLDPRSLTILSVMILCSHNMIVETTVQKKTGTSALRMMIVRTFSAISLAFILNMILPLEVLDAQKIEELLRTQTADSLLVLHKFEWAEFHPLLSVWAIKIAILSLNVYNRYIIEYITENINILWSNKDNC